MSGEVLSLAVDGALRTELLGESEEQEELVRAFEDLKITSEEDCRQVTDFIRKVKAENKALEERKQNVTRPLMGVVEEVRGWFRPAQNWLSQAEAVLKQKLADYRAEVDRKNQAAMALLAAAAEQKDTRALAVATQQFVETPQVKGLGMRTVWDWKLVDPSAVPREFLSVDPAKVKAHIQAAGKSTPAAIPGLEIYARTQVSVR